MSKLNIIYHIKKLNALTKEWSSELNEFKRYILDKEPHTTHN